MNLKDKINFLLKKLYKRKSLKYLIEIFSLYIFSVLKLTSLKLAVKEQGYESIFPQLEKVTKNYTDQYNSVNIEGDFWNFKVKALHAFQVDFSLKAITFIKEELKKKEDEITIVDIGDSSGNHLLYFKEILKDINLRTVSVNLDKSAINKIKSKGLEAIHCKAEDLIKHNINPDIFFSFQTIEHLNSPITFFKSIADNTSCNYYLVTVPYVQKSRMGLEHIRGQFENKIIAENIHIFELNPSDWKLLFKHAGWEPIKEEIFFQYPKKHPLRLLKNNWAKQDFEGFYAVLLKKNRYWADKYLDW